MAPLRVIGDFPRYLARLRKQPGDNIRFDVDTVVDVPTTGSGRIVLHELVRDLPRDPRNEHLVRVEDIVIGGVGDAASVLTNPKLKTQGVRVRVEIATRKASRSATLEETQEDLKYVRATKPIEVGKKQAESLVRRLVPEDEAAAASYRSTYRRLRNKVSGVPLASSRTVVRVLLNVAKEGDLSPPSLGTTQGEPTSRALRIRYKCIVHVVRRPPPYTEARAGKLQAEDAAAS